MKRTMTVTKLVLTPIVGALLLMLYVVLSPQDLAGQPERVQTSDCKAGEVCGRIVSHDCCLDDPCDCADAEFDCQVANYSAGQIPAALVEPIGECLKHSNSWVPCCDYYDCTNNCPTSCTETFDQTLNGHPWVGTGVICPTVAQ